MAREIWVNAQFKKHGWHFIFQSLLIFIYVFVLLMGLMYGRSPNLDILSAIGATSLASSAFMVIGLPKSNGAAPFRIFVGYALAGFSGMAWHYIAHLTIHTYGVPVIFSNCITGALAASTAMLLMAIFDAEHPPAMGLALGLVLEFWDDWTLLVILIAVVVLCLIKILFGRWFINLL